MTLKAARIIVRGMVQGVGFRYYCQKRATAAGLCGWVRNNPDGSVEAWAEGDITAIEQLIADLKVGPSNARVDTVDVLYGNPTGQYRTFEITH